MATEATPQKIVDVVTPAAGESVTEGTILEWHVKLGEEIKLDETIVEISTDKVDVELPSPAAGVVSEILVQEGDTVTVGQVIARISIGANGAAPSAGPSPTERSDTQRSNGAAQNGADAANDRSGAEASTKRSGAQTEEQPSAPEAPTSEQQDVTDAAQIVDVVTPAAGESVSEGTLLEWHVKVGEQIKLDETIVEISTDKVDIELPAPATGTVTELLVAAGDTVTVGQVIARIAAGAAPAAGAPAPGNGAVQAAPSEPPASEAPAPTPDGARISPVAARAAAIEGVDLERVAGSGPAGRITKSDVLSAAGNGAGSDTTAAIDPAGTPPSAGPSSQPMRGAAAALVRYMEDSRSIPTATSFRTITVTQLDARRRELKQAGRKVSFTHLIAFAIARAAQEMQVMANHFEEVDGTESSTIR